jgi:hypothetical protein
MGHFGEQLTTVLMAIVGLATLAVILSRNANTVNVIRAGSGGFSQAIATAISPITGNTQLGPSGGFTGFGGYGG